MPTSEELDRLVQAVATGDRQAYAVLFKHFAPRVKAYLMRGGSPAEVAEELAQEAMVALWFKASGFDPARARCSTWIFTIARNLRIDRHRREAGALALEQPAADADSDNPLAPTLDEHPDPAPSPEALIDRRRRESGLRAALGRLAPEQAAILRLSYFDEQPHARIASELGIPLGTVKSRIRLAVNHLRRLLEGMDP